MYGVVDCRAGSEGDGGLDGLVFEQKNKKLSFLLGLLKLAYKGILILSEDVR